MAVKIKTPDGMKQIDTTLHKPVVFVDGKKKVLDKAWVFVNGEKKMLWGESGVAIDFITAEVESGTWSLAGIGEKWLWASGSSTVKIFDITNLSNPLLKSSVAWGSNWRYNGYQTVDGQYVFYGQNSKTLNKLLVNPLTGEASVGESYTTTADMSLLTKTNYWIGYKNLSVRYTRPGATTTGFTTFNYGTQWVFNSAIRFTTGRKPSGVGDTADYKFQYSSGGIQINNTDILVNISSDGYSTGAGAYKLNYNGFTKVTENSVLNPVMLDGNRVVGKRSYASGSGLYRTSYDYALLLYDSVAFQLVAEFAVDSKTHTISFLGRNGDYYYVIKRPKKSQVGGVSLLLLSKDDLSVVYEQEMPSDPFNEYNGNCDYWLGGGADAYVSQSGFVGFKGSTTSGNTVGRIVRFSALM